MSVLAAPCNGSLAPPVDTEHQDPSVGSPAKYLEGGSPSSGCLDQVYFFFFSSFLHCLYKGCMYQGLHSSKSSIEKIVINLPWQSHPCPTKDTRAEYSSAGREWHSAFCSAEIVLKTLSCTGVSYSKEILLLHTRSPGCLLHNHVLSASYKIGCTVW